MILASIDLTGISLEMAFLTMNNKYGIEISKEAFDSSINRLTN
jgi:hypothetical protein